MEKHPGSHVCRAGDSPEGLDGAQPDLQGAAPQHGTGTQHGGEGRSGQTSIANGLQHEPELEQGGTGP